MDAFGLGIDGIDGKYKSMILDFKTQMEAMQTQADGATLSQQKVFQENFDQLNKQYGKGIFKDISNYSPYPYLLNSKCSCSCSSVPGFEDIKAQMIKANVDLITSFSRNYDGLRDNLKQNYDGIRSQAKINFETNLKKFKDNCDEMIKKIPVLPAKLYQDIIQGLEVNQNKSTEQWEKGYKDVVEKLEALYHQAIKDYTLPIAQNEVTAALASPAAKSGASATEKPSVGTPMKKSPGFPAIVEAVKQGPAPVRAQHPPKK